jgi:hypothetical protein
MPDKRPTGPMPRQTGTTQKGAPTPGESSKPVKVNPGFKGGGGKGGGKK